MIGKIRSKSQYHITIGHSTLMASITIFGLDTSASDHSSDESFDFSREYRYLEEMICKVQKQSIIFLRTYSRCSNSYLIKIN